MSRRQRGSVRFDPYCKVQWWDSTSLAWRDIQLAMPEADALEIAEELIPAEAPKWRLMHISEEGRRPGAEHERSSQ